MDVKKFLRIYQKCQRSTQTFGQAMHKENLRLHLALEDWYKITFTAPWETFVYVIMPFGLCNALLAFQRAMIYVF